VCDDLDEVWISPVAVSIVMMRVEHVLIGCAVTL
jgi:hypothetical protein